MKTTSTFYYLIAKNAKCLFNNKTKVAAVVVHGPEADLEHIMKKTLPGEIVAKELGYANLENMSKKITTMTMEEINKISFMLDCLRNTTKIEYNLN